MTHDDVRREFEAWARVRDYDVTRSRLNDERYASERTQGAWISWGHGASNWQATRDQAIALLREALGALEHHKERTRTIARIDEMIGRIRRALGMEDDA